MTGHRKFLITKDAFRGQQEGQLPYGPEHIQVEAEMKPVIRLAAVVIFLSLPTAAQMTGSAISTGSPISSTGELAVSPTLSPRPFSSIPMSRPVSLRVITVAGAREDFAASSFEEYDQALADGIRGEHPAYVPYEAALAIAASMRAAVVTATPKSVAQAAREFRGEVGRKARATFVQDRNGRIVSQMDSD